MLSLVPYALALLCSALGRFVGRWYLTYWHSSPDAVDRAVDVPVFWQVSTVSRSLWITVLYPNSRLTSPGSCLGHEVLELVRPVVPYTLVLSSKCFGPVVSPASCRLVASQASCRRVASSSLSPLPSSSNCKVIPKNPQNTTVSNRCPLSSRNHRLSIH